MMEELKGTAYEERLKDQTRIVTLEARGRRADMINVFNIIKGLEGLKRKYVCEMEEGQRARRHGLIIYL